MNHRLVYTSIAAFALAAGTIALVRAGSLTPPAGAPQPTMRTLNEIYNLVAQGGGGGGGSQPWSYRHIPLGTSGSVQVATGAGVVRGVMVYPCDCGNVIVLYDSPTADVTGRPVIAELVNGAIGNTSRLMSLEVEFTSGLVYRVVGSGTRGRDTVIFRTN